MRFPIVHLGLGNFHRAHQAPMTQAARAADPALAICGVSLRSAGVTAELAAQSMRYHVIERADGFEKVSNIDVIGEALRADTQLPQVLRRLEEADIISLTVTEKGYCHDPATGQLNAAHPDIAHDLQHPHAPRSPLGGLLHAAQARQARSVGVSGSGAHLTVLCCDNLPANGATVKRLAVQMAALRSDALASFIERNVAFPSTMVDRIVPATTQADRAYVREQLKLNDAAPVMTEPFTQWVIEDQFAGLKPAWHLGGAQFVSDVAPFELAKLRLLNGAHSAMACLGHTVGYQFIYEVASDPLFTRLVEALWRELETTLKAAPGIDVPAYQRALMGRFRNQALPHKTRQIAMDSSQKLPQRLVQSARDRLQQNLSVGTIALVIAGWMRYLAGITESGARYTIEDPLAAQLQRIVEAHAEPRARGAALLEVSAVFGNDIAHDARFREPVLTALESLHTRGINAVLESHLI
jgi:fructuronate reductase